MQDQVALTDVTGRRRVNGMRNGAESGVTTTPSANQCMILVSHARNLSLCLHLIMNCCQPHPLLHPIFFQLHSCLVPLTLTPSPLNLFLGRSSLHLSTHVLPSHVMDVMYAPRRFLYDVHAEVSLSGEEIERCS